MKKRTKKKVEKLTELIQSVEVSLKGDFLQTKCQLSIRESKSNYSFAYYVYKTGKTEAIAKSTYTDQDTHKVKLTEGGEYRVKVFVMQNDNQEVKTRTSLPIRKTQIVDI
ncbi:hypothetical protein X560_2713 [Listeria fleischmannii 1991]|uniref:Two component regulator three Y domain-containing protein n=2 Tax=Listeria fleischmannii TaxID=1069827 RepID=A0A2X3H4L3_9LIST|nr:hypothetical protein [Listeria fleischmannii]EMG28716.1 hypothetical protein LFLEISCH_04005 [Listeria fleischmannii subsp. fleischmannii LU2006-1]KMT57700.1 hypothetical protein X560_2713 [Listeria fleischmannii 1991]SQC69526.1 Uncharacterised protein [Listeria fleischmannii subsp. fleischmannii]